MWRFDAIWKQIMKAYFIKINIYNMLNLYVYFIYLRIYVSKLHNFLCYLFTYS